ncbi:MAG: toll/interleukin-1 receptor domain-containing protein [Methanothrix sp.]|nr:toll/interleukin-1 receptor domain-containing protein [Methanothrix sp.]
MISKVYISHCREDEAMALQLSRALWRVGIEAYAALYGLSPAISRGERVSFGIRNSDCLVALLTCDGSASPEVNQEIGLARGIDLLIIPMLEDGASPPFLIEHLSCISFSRAGYSDAIGRLIRALRELSRLEWLKVTCPSCGEEMTQYLTDQEEIDSAISRGGLLETICSYCQNGIRLDPRTFEPVQ